MHVDIGPRAKWGAALPIFGAARDLRTADGAQTCSVVAEAHVEAEFDTERRLVSIQAAPASQWLADLLGTRAGGGFRRRLEELVPAEQSGSLLRQVLDDLPAAVLISGYAFMRLARREGLDPGTLTPVGVLDRMVDLCSGWRAGGVAVASIGTGNGVPMQDCPPAPSEMPGAPGDDPWAWHTTGALGIDWMRRRRCLDVSSRPDGSFSVWAMFRDTDGEPDGTESVLHEYVVRASGARGVIGHIEAEPRVLPFPECPAAADTVSALEGTPVAELAPTVPGVLAGIASCTHLNDLLRAVGGLSDLLGPAAAG
jgi:hypothetical protein